MVDIYGDGWDTGYLTITDSVGYREAYQPTLLSGYMSRAEYCIDPRVADYGLTVTAQIRFEKYAAIHRWEVQLSTILNNSNIYI